MPARPASATAPRPWRVLRATAAISWECATPAPDCARIRTPRTALRATGRMRASRIRAQAGCARGRIRERARRRISVMLPGHATRLPACACLRPHSMAPCATTATRARKPTHARTARASVVIRSFAWRRTPATLRARATRTPERARIHRGTMVPRATGTERATVACVSARWAKPFRAACARVQRGKWFKVACACARADKKNVLLGLRRHHDGPEQLRRAAFARVSILSATPARRPLA